MAQTSYIELLAGEQVAFYRGLTVTDRFKYGRVTRKVAFFSRKKKKGVSARSILPTVAAAWNGLTDEQRTEWGEVAVYCGLNGYRLFVRDMTYRIANEIVGVATPSIYHQALVGYVSVQSPAVQLEIEQLHPETYWVSQPVKGKKGQREPILVREAFALPLDLSIAYSSNLVAIGSGAYARYIARIWSSYQGVDRFTDCLIELDFISGWKIQTASISNVIGHVVGYTLLIQIYNARGVVFFDNVRAEHSGQNWVRDSACEDIDQAFSAAFYQIPDHWTGKVLPVGASFGSIYPQENFREYGTIEYGKETSAERFFGVQEYGNSITF